MVDYIFNESPDAIYAFQVHQKADYSITLLVVPERSCAEWPVAVEKAKRDLLQRTGGQVAVEVEIVEEIPSDGGKPRVVVSEVMRP